MCLTEDLNLNIYSEETGSKHIELYLILEREFENQFEGTLLELIWDNCIQISSPLLKVGK